MSRVCPELRPSQKPGWVGEKIWGQNRDCQWTNQDQIQLLPSHGDADSFERVTLRSLWVDSRAVLLKSLN